MSIDSCNRLQNQDLSLNRDDFRAITKFEYNYKLVNFWFDFKLIAICYFVEIHGRLFSFSTKKES